MKRPKTSKIVVYPIVEDTIHGLLWVHNRFLCAPSCPIAYTLLCDITLLPVIEDNLDEPGHAHGPLFTQYNPR